MSPPLLQWSVDLGVILLLLLIICLMIWVIETSPIIETDSPYIVFGLTAVATLFTSCIKDRVQAGFIRSLEVSLRSIKLKEPNSDGEKESNSDSESHRDLSQLSRLDRTWRGVLRIDEIKDKIYNKRVVVAYLSCALITTAVVTTFTPTAGQRTIAYSPLIPGNRITYYPSTDVETDHCVAMYPDTEPDEEFPPGSKGHWSLSNGSIIHDKLYGGCIPSRVLSMLSGINSESPDLYAYVDSGVAVHRSALGASSHLFKGEVFGQLSDQYGRSLRSTTQCVPVMTSNPVTCERDEDAIMRRTGEGRMEVALSQSEFVTSGDFRRNLDRDSIMVNGLWEGDTIDAVGDGFFLFAAYNGIDSEGMFAQDLARAMNEPDEEAATGPRDTYIVKCFIEPANAFDYRLVTLDQQAEIDANSPRRMLNGTEKCQPVTESLGNLYRTAPIAAHREVIQENINKDGYIASIIRVAGENRGPPYAFNNSRNAFEDVMGIISALGVSVLDLRDGGSVVADGKDGEGGKASAAIDVRRLGYGSRWMFALVIPPLAALLVLLYFFYQSFQAQYQLGGGLDLVRNPEKYAAESIIELLDT